MSKTKTASDYEATLDALSAKLKSGSTTTKSRKTPAKKIITEADLCAAAVTSTKGKAKSLLEGNDGRDVFMMTENDGKKHTFYMRCSRAHKDGSKFCGVHKKTYDEDKSRIVNYKRMMGMKNVMQVVIEDDIFADKVPKKKADPKKKKTVSANDVDARLAKLEAMLSGLMKAVSDGGSIKSSTSVVESVASESADESGEESEAEFDTEPQTKAEESAEESADEAAAESDDDAKADASDAEASDAEAFNAEASDAEASDAEASNAEASDAEASDAEAFNAEASDAEASDAEASDAEASDAEDDDEAEVEAIPITTNDGQDFLLVEDSMTVYDRDGKEIGKFIEVDDDDSCVCYNEKQYIIGADLTYKGDTYFRCIISNIAYKTDGDDDIKRCGEVVKTSKGKYKVKPE